MDRLDDKAMANNQALETLCFLCWCAPVATGIAQIHFEMGEGKTNRFGCSIQLVAYHERSQSFGSGTPKIQKG